MFTKTLALATAATMTFAFAAHAQDKDIVETAAATGSFTTLLAAVDAAGLTDTLKSEGPFTVFAPTDAAFAALPAGTVEDLLKPENRDTLVSILTYHVLAGQALARDLSEGATAQTVQGQSVTFSVNDGAKVDGAVISLADVMASNGVIHVIDSVIMPAN